MVSGPPGWRCVIDARQGARGDAVPWICDFVRHDAGQEMVKRV
jgi:hypothetical protein